MSCRSELNANSVLTNRREVCGETDDVFLDLGECKGKAKVWLSAIGQTYVDPAVYRIIIIETETAHMQFNEKSYFK